MDKDTFLGEIRKVRKKVNWTQVAYDLGLNLRTVVLYIDGERQNTDRMAEILQCAKDQLIRKAKQYQEAANSLI